MSKEINRERIFVGKVGLASNVIKYTEEAPFIVHETMEVGQLYPLNWKEYRTILFTPTSENYGQDLIYDTPDYPVFNMSLESNFDYVRADKGCYRPDEIVAIKDTYNLDYLLKELGYPKLLSREEIIFIRRNIFNAKFLKNNALRFGLVEKPAPPRYTGVSVVGEPIYDKVEYLKNRIEYLIKKLQGKNGYEMFTAESFHNAIELRKYIWIINEMRDASFLEWLTSGFENKIDAFKPKAVELVKRKRI